MIEEINTKDVFDFPISPELESFLDSVNSFAVSYADLIAFSAKNTDNDSQNDVKIEQLRLMYSQMHTETERLKEIVDVLRACQPDRRNVTYGPAPLHTSNEYPMYQSFSGFFAEI